MSQIAADELQRRLGSSIRTGQMLNFRNLKQIYPGGGRIPFPDFWLLPFHLFQLSCFEIVFC